MLSPIHLTSLALFLFNSLFSADVSQHPHVRPRPEIALNFHLRHFHAETSSAQVYLANMPHDLPSATGFVHEPVSIITSPMRTTRPSSPEKFTASRHMSQRGQSAILDWEEDEVTGPDVTRRETLLLLAKMTSNSYFVPGNREWYNLT